MRNYHKLGKLNKMELNTVIQRTSHEPIATQEATKRMVKILDLNYKKADLAQVVAGTTHLDKIQKKKLYRLLREYEDLFDGSLGTWQTAPVDFELKEDAEPHSQRLYPVSH